MHIVGCHTINIFKEHKLQKKYKQETALNYQKHRNRNERFSPNDYESSPFFYIIPEIIFLLIIITILYKGLKYAT